MSDLLHRHNVYPSIHKGFDYVRTRQDSLVDDWTFIGTRERGNFRLHPLRPDGTGVSDGCITFYNHTDFNVLRDYLLRAHTMIIPVLGQKAYGEIEVLGDINAPCLHF